MNEATTVSAETKAAKPAREFEVIEGINLQVQFVNVRTLKNGTAVPVLQLNDDTGTTYEMWFHGATAEQLANAGIARGASWTQDLSVAKTPDLYKSPKTGKTSETYPAKPAGEASEFVPAWTTKRAFPMLT